MSPTTGGSSSTAGCRIVGSGVAGGLELMLFHPVDTVIKRMMNSKLNFSSANAREIIFQDKVNAPLVDRMKSLFPGLGYGAAYKMSQRIYKFGGQPFVKEYAKKTCQPQGKIGKTLCDGFAGSLMGAGEVVLLPFDVLKIKCQTNPEYRGKSFLGVFKSEGVANLYAGWNWTMARNVPGSFSLFGANALVKEFVFGLEDHRDATFFQTTVASTAGSVTSIIVACPLDVVKTRVQSGMYEGGGAKILSDIWKNEGMGAFFKGATPKVMIQGPKLIFSFTIAQYLMSYLEKWSAPEISIGSPALRVQSGQKSVAQCSEGTSEKA